MDSISSALRRLCPRLSNLAKVNRSNYNEYPEIQEVMACHTRSSIYLVQFFKEPLVAPCGCQACRLQLWEPPMLNPELSSALPHKWQLKCPCLSPCLWRLGNPGTTCHFIKLGRKHSRIATSPPLYPDRQGGASTILFGFLATPRSS